MLRSSSRVDEKRVRACRTALFDHLVTGPSRRAQDAFHRATGPGDEALGVRMSREDACTVSTTTVEVFEDQIAMAYCASFPMKRASVTEHLQASHLAERVARLPTR